MLSNKAVGAILTADDLDRAANFYKETLGLKEEMRDENGLLLDAGQGTKLFIYEKRGAARPDNTVAGFNVDNIEQEVEELKSKGVNFEEYDMPGLKTVNGIAAMDGGKTAWFKDSEGNIIALNQMRD
jgi:predicted enzyme related to lactoylglutathione lyase